jgi:hypothetical protein
LIQQLIEDTGSTMEACHMNVHQQQWNEIIGDGNRLIQEQMQLGYDQTPGIAEAFQNQLNPAQSQAFDQIVQSTISSPGKVFFLDGPAGTGKTFLYKTLCYRLRSERKIVLCVASSGIAALLLPGGRTSHSRLKIPLKLKDNSTCNINKNSDLGRMIKRAKLIIWDEVPMQHKLCAHAFDKTARDLFDQPDLPFGGITVVFGGDFRQTLPVVPHGDRQEIIAASLRRSYIWGLLHKLHLNVNMRVQNDPEAANFAQFLLDVGMGTTVPAGADSGTVEFPLHMLVDSENALFRRVYPNLSTMAVNDFSNEYFRDSAILAARNTEVTSINGKVLDSFPGQETSYYSINKVVAEAGADNEDTAHFTPEYLGSLDTASLPPHHLRLKVGVPVMVLRNLAASQGVCNGSRGIITHLGRRTIEMRLLTGTHAGK